MSSETTNLFTPVTIGGLELSNRIVVSPMCQYSSEDGFATDWHLVHLGSRASGGASLVIVEASAVSPEGRITPGDMGFWKDEHIAKHRQIIDFAHSQGSRIGIQLAHAGRKASMAVPWKPEGALAPQDGGWTNVVAPSAIAFASNYPLPVALDSAGIRKVTDDFKAAAQRAAAAGFNVVEIHAAHGYLLHEFLSPLSNKRTDEYGGSFANRIRLMTEVVDAVKTEWTGPLFVRISATDWAEGGWNVDEAVELSKVLKIHGVHLMDVSSGGLAHGVEIPAGPGYQTPFAERIRKEAGIATGAVGIIVDPAQADHIIRTGQADIVLLARELLRDPYWPMHAALRLGKKASWPVQYLRAAPPASPERNPLRD